MFHTKKVNESLKTGYTVIYLYFSFKILNCVKSLCTNKLFPKILQTKIREHKGIPKDLESENPG